MAALELTTGGESHGPGLTAIVSGMPAGLRIDRDAIDGMLARRQAGHGRSARQRIETDRVEVTGGIRHGRTLGSPIVAVLPNREHRAWTSAMSVWDPPAGSDGWRERPVTVPRPGHADLAGMARLGTTDARPVLERASARETAARTIGGAIARQFLAALGIRVRAHVRAIGGIHDAGDPLDEAAWARVGASPVACADDRAAEQMVAAIDAARQERTTLGGTIEVQVDGLPPGIGGYAVAAERLGARLGGVILSVPGIRSVEVGDGHALADVDGRHAHDEVVPAGPAGAGDLGMGVSRTSNRSGGIEGGMSTGAPVILRAAMKPLSTLMRPLQSVDMATGMAAAAHTERSDVCAVPAASVVVEAVVAFELARVLRATYGMPTISDVVAAHAAYCRRVGSPEPDGDVATAREPASADRAGEGLQR